MTTVFKNVLKIAETIHLDWRCELYTRGKDL